MEGREAFRDLLWACASEDDGVFDGDGRIKNLGEYFEGIQEWLDENGPVHEGRRLYGFVREVPDFSFMAGNFGLAASVPEALREWLRVPEAFTESPLPPFRWTDGVFGIVATNTGIAMGAVDGIERIETFDSQVFTNAFDMDNDAKAYEFSARTWFYAYGKPAEALRIRLEPAPAAGGGCFTWPEEDEEADWLFSKAGAPCLRGEIDGSGQVYVVVRPDGPDEEAMSAHIRFLEDVMAAAEARGFTVDRRIWRPNSPTARGASQIDCYRTEETSPWILLGIRVSYEGQLRIDLPSSVPPRPTLPAPIRVDNGYFDSYADALAEIECLLDGYQNR